MPGTLAAPRPGAAPRRCTHFARAPSDAPCNNEGTITMAYQRPAQRELAAARKVVRQQEMQRAIDEGRLTVRLMTADERAHSEARADHGGGRPRSSGGAR